MWPASKPPPSIMVKPCKGNMADQCRSRGRETAVTPRAQPVGDGRISRAFLQSRAARQVCDALDATADELVERSGAMNTPATLAGWVRTAGEATIPSDDEDPFGHGGLLDEPQPMPRGVSGNATPRGEAPLSESVGEVTVPEEASYDRSTALPSGPVGQEAAAALLGAHESHVLTRTAHVVWCRVCGRHAAIRLGIGLQRPCVGQATGAYPARIERLRGRRHPVTAEPLEAATHQVPDVLH